MYAVDFMYDDKLLSDFDCVICDFEGSSGIDTVKIGSSITFNKISRNYGRSYSLIGTQFGECFTTTFDICKNPSECQDLYFTSAEYRDIVRWLNRSDGFHEFKVLLDNDANYVFFNACFNVDKIKHSDRTCGIRVTMETDKPYGFGATSTQTIGITNVNNSYPVTLNSDEIGAIYPVVVITCNSSGTLNLQNLTLNKTTTILGCTSGEVITINGNTLSLSSSTGRNLLDYFNYVFPQLTNTLNNRINDIKSSLLANITYTFNPIIKDFP